MNMDTKELMGRGAQCLMDELGIIDAERFITSVLRRLEMDVVETRGRGTEKLFARGVQCLQNELGDAGTQTFIEGIQSERFDYTQWQRAHFAGEDLESLNAAATAWAQEHEARFGEEPSSGGGPRP